MKIITAKSRAEHHQRLLEALLDAKRAALDAYADHVTKIVGGDQS